MATTSDWEARALERRCVHCSLDSRGAAYKGQDYLRGLQVLRGVEAMGMARKVEPFFWSDAREACSGFASDSKADQLQRDVKAHSITGVTSHDTRQAFAEDALCEEAIQAAEAARAQAEAGGHTVPRQVGHPSRVVTVDTRREAAAARAPGPGALGTHH